jgi:hypothetical protein
MAKVDLFEKEFRNPKSIQIKKKYTIAIYKLIANSSLLLQEIINESTNKNNLEEINSNFLIIYILVIYNDKEKLSSSIENIILKIYSILNFEESTILLSIIYIDRLCANKDLILTEKNFKR